MTKHDERNSAVRKELMEKLPTKCFVGLSLNEAETVMAMVDNFVVQAIAQAVKARDAHHAALRAKKLGELRASFNPTLHYDLVDFLSAIDELIEKPIK